MARSRLGMGKNLFSYGLLLDIVNSCGNSHLMKHETLTTVKIKLKKLKKQRRL